MVIKLFEFVS